LLTLHEAQRMRRHMLGEVLKEQFLRLVEGWSRKGHEASRQVLKER